mmetsp:Transcript_43162/g.104147  ORF Transcript_43162/g.104147 Transcript_43162/m.104147 type:complete len:180 (+) Transcript_43162:3-542(+)
MTKEFTQRACAGVQCELVSMANGTRQQGSYSLNDALSELVIAAFDSQKEARWPLEWISSVERANEVQWLKVKKLELGLSDSDLARGLLLSCARPQSSSRDLMILLEQNARHREVAHAALRILKVFASAETPPSSPKQGLQALPAVDVARPVLLPAGALSGLESPKGSSPGRRMRWEDEM